MPTEVFPGMDPKPFLEAGLTLRNRIQLSELGTFQLGGPVEFLVECTAPHELARIRKISHEKGLRPLLIGEGSNLLFADAGWPGILVRYCGGDSIPVSTGDGIWCFNASINLQQVVDWATEKGLAGLQAFNGIPGTLGGAVVGNAGAWGVQMEHVLTEVHGYDPDGKPRELKAVDCGFSYRDSAMKYNEFWVSEVCLRLHEGNREELLAEKARILTLRAARHPDLQTDPCIGSFFKNLEPSSAAERRQAAGYFLEKAGAKSFRMGGAGVFEGHANILVKQHPDCRAEDVAALARKLQAAVKEMHGIDLVREVRYLGDIPGESAGNGFY